MKPPRLAGVLSVPARLLAAALLVAGLLAVTTIMLTGCEALVPSFGATSSPPDTIPTEVTGMRNFGMGWGGTAHAPWAVTMAVHAPQVDTQAVPEQPGNVVVYCVVEIANEGERVFSYHLDDFTLSGEETVCSGGGPDGSLVTVSEPPLLSGSLEPGQTVRGAVAFEFSPDEVSTLNELVFVHLGSPGMWTAWWGEE